jgi:hypothetical protein
MLASFIYLPFIPICYIYCKHPSNKRPIPGPMQVPRFKTIEVFSTPSVIFPK